MPYEPGFLNQYERQDGWRTGTIAGYFISGEGPAGRHAEISDSSCLQRDAIGSEGLQ